MCGACFIDEILLLLAPRSPIWICNVVSWRIHVVNVIKKQPYQRITIDGHFMWPHIQSELDWTEYNAHIELLDEITWLITPHSKQQTLAAHWILEKKNVAILIGNSIFSG